MKYYLIAGEASGDLHGSNLMQALRLRDPGSEFRCWGGDLMEQAGGVLVKHYRDLAFMGFAEVLMNLRTILSNLAFCKKDIDSWKPDAVILIDYPGFNLKIAEYAHTKGFKVFYYISPQLWAWRSSRVKKIRAFVDRMFVILPFEKQFYQSHDVTVDFVGHPLLDAMERSEKGPERKEFMEQLALNDKPVIALLPGSRKQEISIILCIMLKMPARFKEYQFVIGAAPSVPDEFYHLLTIPSGVRIYRGPMHTLLQHSTAALVTSGTATLETALMGVPQVVCYKGSWISFQIAKRIVHVPFISLVNLIMEREVVIELIQDDLNPAGLEKELLAILDGQKREAMRRDYEELKRKLGEEGASDRTAELMVQYLSSK